MGFLKFLKREKKKDELDELDLPPAPPPLEGFDENIPLPEFPDIGIDKISGIEEMPKFDISEIEEKVPELGKEEIVSEFPTFPSMEEKPVTASSPITAPTSIPESIQPIFSMPETKQQEESRFTLSDKYVKRERARGKIIYVKVDKFKATLGSINVVRSDLRKSEEALMKLENLKNTKDKSLDKVRSLLIDLQKKLIFIDRTLFKGE